MKINWLLDMFFVLSWRNRNMLAEGVLESPSVETLETQIALSELL